MLTYGGVSLLVPPAGLLQWVEANISPRDLYYLFNSDGLGRRPVPHAHHARIGTLFWPHGASQWARGYFLATDSQLAAIRSQVYAAGSYNPRNLVMAEGVSVTNRITTSLYMLPARPLQQLLGADAKGAEGLWLLSLVDERFFWWDLAESITVTAGTTTWAQLYTAIGTALGITINADAVAAEYLKPARSLTIESGIIPPMLDAVAASVGHRIVRRLDGTVYAQNPTTAKARLAIQFPSTTPRQAGGMYAFEPNKPHDLSALAPNSVTVLYPRSDGGKHTEVVTLASLALTEYAGVTGRPWTMALRSNATANYIDAAPTNETELETLAEAIARDWFRWTALGRLDWKFAGVARWEPEGAHDCEWVYGGPLAAECSTRVTRRDTFLSTADELPLHHHGTHGSLIEGEASSGDINSYRDATAALDVYYPGGNITGNYPVYMSAENVIHAVSFIVPGPDPFPADQIAVWLNANGAAGKKCRLAIYDSNSMRDIYPRNLVVGTGEIAIDAGAPCYVKGTIAVTLEPGRQYWLCYIGNSATAELGGTNDVFMWPVFGLSRTSFSQLFGIRLQYTYAAFPAAFPSDDAGITNGAFIIPVLHPAGAGSGTGTPILPPGDGASDIARTSVATGVATNASTLTMAATAVSDECMLVVVVSVMDVGTAPTITTVKYGADFLTEAAAETINGDGFDGEIAIYYFHVPAADSEALEVTVSGASDYINAFAYQVVGLTDYAVDLTANAAASTLSQPDTGVMANTSEPDEYVQAAFWFLGGVNAWQNGFTTGQAAANGDGVVTEGYRILSTISAPHPRLSGTAVPWAGVGATFS